MQTLKLTSPMMHGPAVVRLQEMCDLIGFDTGPNDGIFGMDTREAVLQVQDKFKIEADGICGPITWKFLIHHIDSQSERETSPGVNVYYIQGKHKRPKLFGYKRHWNEISGITFHQTGCNMPQKPDGWSRLNAHIGITQEGKCILVNDFTDMIWHAQKLSRYTIGIEIEGNFRGIRNRASTLWKGGGGPHYLNYAMKMALDEAFEIIKSEFKKNNQEWTNIYAHRQSSKSRRADPGSEIWDDVAMQWGERLGLKYMDGGPDWRTTKGLVIPKTWNPKYKGKY